MEKVTGYCMKCKINTEMADGAEEITMKNGRKAMKGKCPKCNTQMFRILGWK
jgi:Zn finger protein HypA/HybF involved in hydrogenase expression